MVSFRLKLLVQIFSLCFFGLCLSQFFLREAYPEGKKVEEEQPKYGDLLLLDLESKINTTGGSVDVRNEIFDVDCGSQTFQVSLTKPFKKGKQLSRKEIPREYRCEKVFQTFFCNNNNNHNNKFKYLDTPNDFTMASKLALPLPKNPLPTKEPNKISIVFFIMAHKWPARVIRLVQRLYQSHHYFYIHVDKHLEAQWLYMYYTLTDHFVGFSNIFVVANFGNNWGGVSLLYSEFHAFLDVLHLEWNYFINLSETDYSCKSMAYIELYLRNLEGKSLISNETDHQLTVENINSFFVDCGTQVGIINNIKNPSKTPSWLDPTYLQLAGSRWHILHRDFIEYVVRSDQAQELLFFMRNFHVPDESYYAILAAHMRHTNHEMADKIVNLPSHVVKERITCDDVNTMKDKEQLFMRKFLDEAVLDCCNLLAATPK